MANLTKTISVAVFTVLGACGTSFQRESTIVSSVSIPAPSAFGAINGKTPQNLRLWVAANVADLQEAFSRKKLADCEMDGEGRILVGGQKFCSIKQSADGNVQANAKFKTGFRAFFALRLYEDVGATQVLAETNVTAKDDKGSLLDCGFAEEVLEGHVKVALPVCAQGGLVAGNTESTASGTADISVEPVVISGGNSNPVVDPTPTSVGPSTLAHGGDIKMTRTGNKVSTVVDFVSGNPQSVTCTLRIVAVGKNAAGDEMEIQKDLSVLGKPGRVYHLGTACTECGWMCRSRSLHQNHDE